MDPHSFYLLDPNPEPHSEKLLDPDPQNMNADPQPCFLDNGMCNEELSPLQSFLFTHGTRLK